MQENIVILNTSNLFPFVLDCINQTMIQYNYLRNQDNMIFENSIQYLLEETILHASEFKLQCVNRNHDELGQVVFSEFKFSLISYMSSLLKSHGINSNVPSKCKICFTSTALILIRSDFDYT